VARTRVHQRLTKFITERAERRQLVLSYNYHHPTSLHTCICISLSSLSEPFASDFGQHLSCRGHMNKQIDTRIYLALDGGRALVSPSSERAQKGEQLTQKASRDRMAWHHMGVHLSSKDILLRLCKRAIMNERSKRSKRGPTA
jgi:hypothetical protein